MATTPTYGWETPDDTDLVKDGAAAIRTLGNAIDTTMGTMVPKTIVDAKGDIIAATAADTVARLAVGTNDQVLTADSSTATGLAWKASATSPLTTKGDLFTYTTTNARLGVGANGTVLQADSSQSTGIKWTPAGRYLLASGSLSGSTLDLTSINGNYTHLEVIFKNFFGSADQSINGTINNDSAANQYGSNGDSIGNITYNGTSYQAVFPYDATNQNNFVLWRYYDYAGSSHKLMQGFFNSSDANVTSRYVGIYYTSIYKSTSAISRLTYTTSTGTWSGGTYEVWGVK